MNEQQILRSTYRSLASITFPDYHGHQIRYHEFDLADPKLAPGFEDYLPTVVQLCTAANALVGTAYLTIDEKLVEAGMSQRRPKPHVDGCFRRSGVTMNWGGGGVWLHDCNDVGATVVGRMAVIVAASVAGCRAWKGIFTGRPAQDGDLSHIADQLGPGEILAPNTGYLLSPDCVHESLTFDQKTLRSFIRIALPVSFAEASVWD